MNPPLPDRSAWIGSTALPTGWPQAVAALLIALVLAAVGLVAAQMSPFPLELIFAALGCGAVLALLALLNEKAWVWLTLLFHISMLVGNVKTGLGVGEIIYLVCVLGGTGLWFLKEMLVRRRLLALTGFDVLLLTFFVVMTVLSVTASTINEADPLQFAKEWGTIAAMLFYFPLRTTLRSERDVRILCVLIFVVMIANSLAVFATYRERLADAVYTWQVRITRTNINEPTSAAMLITSALLFAYARRWWVKLVAFVGIGTASVCLVLSFSRGPMVAAVIGMVVSWIFIPVQRSRKIVIAFFAALVIGGAAFYVALPQFVNYAASGITARLSSLSTVRQDLSLYARVVESETLFDKYISHSPLIGYGFATMFEFITPIGNKTLRTSFIHNGIVWSLYKFGVPCAILLYIVIVFPLGSALTKLPVRDDRFLRPIVAGVIGVNLSGLIMNMTSNIFSTSGILNMVLGWALLDYVWRHAAEKQRQIAGGDGE